MDQSKLNIVIVGLGNISKTYIECIKKNKYAKLVAVCDISKKKLNEIKFIVEEEIPQRLRHFGAIITDSRFRFSTCS